MLRTYMQAIPESVCEAVNRMEQALTPKQGKGTIH